MYREGNTCPRGHQALVPTPGGCYCLSCGYTEEADDLSLYAGVMANMPGIPLPSRVERHEDEMRRVKDIALAEEMAVRHGASLEQLQQRMYGWRQVDPKARRALQAVIEDLTVEGLGLLRISNVLHRHPRTIGQTVGLARGRARRKRVCP